MWSALGTFLAAADLNTVTVIIAFIAAIAGTGGIAAFFTARSQNKKIGAEALKLRAEAEVLPIDLAKGAVVVQADVIKDLRTQIEDQERRIVEQSAEFKRERHQRIVELDRERRFAQASADRANAEHDKLKEQCSALEDKFRDMLARFEAMLIENDRLKDEVEKYRATHAS